MTIAIHRVYRLKDSFRFSTFEDGGVVFDLESRACHEINRSAAQIISHLNGEKSLRGLIDEVSSEYASPPEVIEKDLIDFVENLFKKGWLDEQ